MFVALKEITLQEEEGIPFTAIREGKKHSEQEFTQKIWNPFYVKVCTVSEILVE